MAEATTDAATFRDLGSLTAPEWLAVLLAVVTALIHIYLGVTEGLTPFVLAGIGFLLGAVVFLTAYWRRWFYLVAALFAAVQIVLWIVAGMRFFQIGAADKVVQALFVVVVLYLYRAGR